MKLAHAVAVAFAALSGVSATAVAPKACARGRDESSKCVSMAEDGACDSSRWQSFMRQHCQTSCAFCSDGRTDSSLAVKVKKRMYGPSQPWRKQEVKTGQTKKVKDQVTHKTQETHNVKEPAKDVAKAKCKNANRAAPVIMCAEGFHLKNAENAYCAGATCKSDDSSLCCEEVTLFNAQTQAEYYNVLVRRRREHRKGEKMPKSAQQEKLPQSALQHKTVKNLRAQQHKTVKTPATQKAKNCKMLPDVPNAGCVWRLGCDVSVDFMKKNCATFCGFCHEEEHKEPKKMVTTPAPKKMVTNQAPKKMVTAPAPKKMVTTPAPTHSRKVSPIRSAHAFAQESAPDSNAQEDKALSDEEARADDLMAKSDKEIAEADSEKEKAEEAAKEVKELSQEVKGLKEKNMQAKQEADVARESHEKTMEEEKAKEAKLLGTDAAPANAKQKSAEPHVAKNPLRSFFAAILSPAYA